MRDLSNEEIGNVYGAGGKGRCAPPPCGGGKGSKSKGSKSKGSKSKGSRCKGSSSKSSHSGGHGCW
ncbi:MAG: hypothetical protein E6G94_09235 [Alphaproteobacteria bacterium]|nr:MAG: hypothetical protein E6G94_09235 [Alphaproteobacteria bacterium]